MLPNLLRGLANSPTKLVLKYLLTNLKPEICFSSKLWMSISDFPVRWLNNIGLKLCTINAINNLIPNLWCLCSIQLKPTMIAIDDQQISLSVEFGGKFFGRK